MFFSVSVKTKMENSHNVYHCCQSDDNLENDVLYHFAMLEGHFANKSIFELHWTEGAPIRVNPDCYTQYKILPGTIVKTIDPEHDPEFMIVGIDVTDSSIVYFIQGKAGIFVCPKDEWEKSVLKSLVIIEHPTQLEQYYIETVNTAVEKETQKPYVLPIKRCTNYPDFSQLLMMGLPFADVIIQIKTNSGTHNFSTNSLLIASESFYFKKLLQSGMKESFDRKISIQLIDEFEVKLFSQLMTFVHTGEAQVEMSNILEFWKLVDRFQMDTIKDILVIMSQIYITPETVFEFLDFCLVLPQPGIIQRCKHILYEQRDIFLRDEEWKRLPQPFFIYMLEVISKKYVEYAKFVAMLRWSEGNPERQKYVAENLISQLDLSKLAATELEEVEKSNFLSEQQVLDMWYNFNKAWYKQHCLTSE